jgi:hypothetical protein
MTSENRSPAITRRHALRGIAGAGAGLAGACLLGTRAHGSPALAAACTLTAEQDEGPYYLGLERIRKNITEGKAGGSAGSRTYRGGHVAHTGQLFFSDTTTDKVARLSPYTRNGARRTRNAEDHVYSDEHGASVKLHLKRRKAATIKSGFAASITLGIDPDATPSPG